MCIIAEILLIASVVLMLSFTTQALYYGLGG